MHKSSYHIKNNDFKKLYSMVREAYGNMYFINLFCKEYADIDEFYIVMPLIKNTYKLIDKVHSELINMS